MSSSQASESPFSHAAGAPGGFLIQSGGTSCAQCWGCLRACPARAIRVVEGHCEIVQERCVKCGACVVGCGPGLHTVRDDTAAVRRLLRSGRPVVALLASEASSALYPRTLEDVEASLELVGFTAVETTVLGEEMIAEAFDRAFSGDRMLPHLRSTCPVTVEWVKRFYPQLTGALVPLVPPYVAQARLIRRIYPDDVAVVYVSPCFARKDEIFEPGLAGAVDVAIDFAELQGLLASVPARPRTGRPGARRPKPIKQLSLTDGFPRAVLSPSSGELPQVTVVRGLDEIDELLAAIVRGETAPPIVDMLLCDGCLDGPAVAPELSVYAKRAIVSAEREREQPPIVDNRTLLAALPAVELQRSFRAMPALTEVPSTAEVDASLAEGGFASRDAVLDCGACGYPTCVEHAEAVIFGHSTWELCPPHQRGRIDHLAEQLDRLAARDPLTGLYNRRAFDERLEQEVSRSRRHDSPLSLIMLDLDGFKAVNDEFGHPTGDAVLATSAALLTRELRASDVACRYGGDEFAVILPDSGKTEAFAVAEKLRESVRSTPVPSEELASIEVSCSIGVATLGDSAPDARSLLSAADRALYRAKTEGKDRTQLAPG